jgi:hypothetical protein
MADGFKRALFWAGCVVLALIIVLPAMGAPLQQEPRPVIAQPEQDSTVRGVVQIIGTAVHPQFQRYELYYAPWPVPSDQSWVFIGDAKYQQQPLGLLGTWDTRAVPDGGYALRVRVVKQDGNYLDSDPVFVANHVPEHTPTPTETATPKRRSRRHQPTVAVGCGSNGRDRHPDGGANSLPLPEAEAAPEPEPTRIARQPESEQ